jgi:putative flippase GtrA
VVEVGGAALAVAVPLDRMSRASRVRHPLLAQVVRYVIVGGLGTVVNAAIFLVLRTWWDTTPANLVALVLSTAVSTEVNRRFTFGGIEVHRWRSYVQSGATVLFYAFYSSTVLMLLDQVVDSPTAWEQTVVVAVASVLGGLVRFLVLRYWVFGPDGHDEPAPGPAEAAARAGRLRPTFRV